MVDDYAASCERQSANEITVNRYAQERPGTGQAGQTRQSGVMALGVPNPREREQACFRGKELIRRTNTR
jgi:hypothetical protein